MSYHSIITCTGKKDNFYTIPDGFAHAHKLVSMPLTKLDFHRLYIQVHKDAKKKWNALSYGQRGLYTRSSAYMNCIWRTLLEEVGDSRIEEEELDTWHHGKGSGKDKGKEEEE